MQLTAPVLAIAVSFLSVKLSTHKEKQNNNDTIADRKWWKEANYSLIEANILWLFVGTLNNKRAAVPATLSNFLIKKVR